MWAIEIHRLGLEILGLWPKNVTLSMKTLWWKLHAGIILILLIFVSNVPTICTLMQVWGNMVLVIDVLRLTLPLLIVSIKYIIIRWKQAGMSRIVLYV